MRTHSKHLVSNDLIAICSKGPTASSIQAAFVRERLVRRMAGTQLGTEETRLKGTIGTSKASGGAALCCVRWNPVETALDGFFCSLCRAYVSHKATDWVGSQNGSGFLFKFCEKHLTDDIEMEAVPHLNMVWPMLRPGLPPLRFALAMPREDETILSLLLETPESESPDEQRPLIEDEISGHRSHLAYQLLARRGTYFVPQPRPVGIPKMPVCRCLENALRLSERKPELTCAVGLVSTRQDGVVAHAWCVDAGGRVVDPTWRSPQDHQYLGFRVKGSLLERRLAGNGLWFSFEHFEERDLLDALVGGTPAAQSDEAKAA